MSSTPFAADDYAEIAARARALQQEKDAARDSNPECGTTPMAGAVKGQDDNVVNPPGRTLGDMLFDSVQEQMDALRESGQQTGMLITQPIMSEEELNWTDRFFDTIGEAKAANLPGTLYCGFDLAKGEDSTVIISADYTGIEERILAFVESRRKVGTADLSALYTEIDIYKSADISVAYCDKNKQSRYDRIYDALNYQMEYNEEILPAEATTAFADALEEMERLRKLVFGYGALLGLTEDAIAKAQDL